MFNVRDRRTGALFDPWSYLGPKRRKLLDRSWAGLFRKEILPHLPVGDAGRLLLLRRRGDCGVSAGTRSDPVPARGEAAHRVFANGSCLGCPSKTECLIKPVREGYGFRYTERALRLARRRAAEKTQAFKDRYRHRSGIESTMSAFDRLTGVKRLRVRGFPAVRFAVVLKALGVISEGARRVNSNTFPLVCPFIPSEVRAAETRLALPQACFYPTDSVGVISSPSRAA